MQYRNDIHGEPISALGYGCMRFSKKGIGIDLDKAEKEILKAIELGVNYFDTAYSYPGSEAALGEILERTDMRDKVNIATKLPQYMVKSSAGIDKYFKEELSRLRTDHVDYYLMHMFTDIAAFEKMQRFGIEEWIAARKADGSIRNIGFSYHGNTEMFLQILNAYDWDFCQIQYNYLDEKSQAGREGLMAAAAKGIPVIIMEPLRGGKLTDGLPAAAKEIISKDPAGRSAAELALRWLWDQPQVTCVLSGMNSIEMIEENCRVADDALPGKFGSGDFDVYKQLKEAIDAATKVGCTGCGYCMPCPQGVDIPTIFRCYNRMYSDKKNAGRWEYLQITSLQKEMRTAANCINCGKCVSRCPQKIHIPDELVKADKALMPFYIKAALKVVRVFKFW